MEVPFVVPYVSITFNKSTARLPTMVFFKKYLYLSYLLLVTTLAGCASNPGIIDIKLPEPKPVAQNIPKTIFIRSVTDTRIFQDNPERRDTPFFHLRQTHHNLHSAKKENCRDQKKPFWPSS